MNATNARAIAFARRPGGITAQRYMSGSFQSFKAASTTPLESSGKVHVDPLLCHVDLSVVDNHPLFIVPDVCSIYNAGCVLSKSISFGTICKRAKVPGTELRSRLDRPFPLLEPVNSACSALSIIAFARRLEVSRAVLNRSAVFFPNPAT